MTSRKNGPGRRQSSTARVRAACAALLALLCAAVPASLRAQEGPEITAIRFPGATSLSRTLLRSEMATRATRCRSPLFALLCRAGAPFGTKQRFHLTDSTQVVIDAERIATLYEAWGYPHALVEPRIVRRNEGSVVIEFHVDEGEPLIVETIAVTGVDAFTPAIRIAPVLPLAVGEPYALPRLEAAEEYLRALLAERGHPHATVDVGGSVDEARLRASLVFRVTPGPAAVFGAVEVQATSPITEAAVRERLQVQPGAPFRASALEQTERRLYDLPIVARASASARAVAGETIVPVTVLVEARRQRGVDLEGTISSTDCAEVGAFWRDRWFLGGPRMLTIGASASNLLAEQAGGKFPCTSAGTGAYGRPNYYAQAELWQPGLLGARNSALLRAFASRESSPGVYIQEGFGAEVSIARNAARGVHAQLGYAPERNSLDAAGLYFCSNYGQCTAQEIDRLSGARWLAPVQLQLRWTSAGADREARLDPVTGLSWSAEPLPQWRHRASLVVEAANAMTGSEYAFRRGIIEATTTRGMGSIELAAHSRFGISLGDDLLPPQLRLYSGGPNSVRGVAQNLAGPKVIVLDSTHAPQACSTCGAGAIDPTRASVRPTGGDRVLELNVEARYWLSSSLQLAAFADYGRITGTELRDVAPYDHTQHVITPGVGIRFITDLGPIRFDLGYDPSRARRYPAFIESGEDVRHAGTVLFDPYGWDDAGGVTRFMRRLQFHMAIGQAF